MNSEDEEFNRVERESKQRMEAVYQEVQKRNKAMEREYAYERGVMRGRESKREWVGLTEEDMAESARWADEHGGGPFHIAYAQALERTLKERNT